jgi:hypothetical protein
MDLEEIIDVVRKKEEKLLSGKNNNVVRKKKIVVARKKQQCCRECCSRNVDGHKCLPCPCPSEIASRRLANPFFSASFIKSAVGSAPVERTKMIGVAQLLSSKLMLSKKNNCCPEKKK